MDKSELFARLLEPAMERAAQKVVQDDPAADGKRLGQFVTAFHKHSIDAIMALVGPNPGEEDQSSAS